MVINKDCAYYCIAIIRCLMQETEIPPLPASVSLQDVFDFCRLHNVEAMVYHGLEQLEMNENDPVWLNLQNRAAMILTQSIVQLAERDVLFKALPEAGIQLLPVKGCWMKDLYPDIDWRQMSDLDMLIPVEKSCEARNLLLSMGYNNNPHDNEPRHASYYKGNFTKIELHVSLHSKIRNYYDDVWMRAVETENQPGLYRFSAEDEYIYYFQHLYEHLSTSGSGIRTILDSVVYRKTYPAMDRVYLESELRKLELWEFAVQIEAISDCWFDTGASVPEVYAGLAEFILNAGAYGRMDNFIDHQSELYRRKYKNSVVRVIVYAITKTCRPRKEMERSYPILKKLPFLLPFTWILRAALRFSKSYRKIWYQLTKMFNYRGTQDES